MDIWKQLPSGDASRNSDTEAVAQLHKTLVVLRKELEAKNDQIRKLESQIVQNSSFDEEDKSNVRFDEIFELDHVSDDNESRNVTPLKMYHQFNGEVKEAPKRAKVRPNQGWLQDESAQENATAPGDMVVDFVHDFEDDSSPKSSTEDEKVPNVVFDRQERKVVNGFTVHHSGIRPILKTPSNSELKISSSSQTDISALTIPRSSRKRSVHDHLREWNSEPVLAKSNNVKFRLPPEEIVDDRKRFNSYDFSSNDWSDSGRHTLPAMKNKSSNYIEQLRESLHAGTTALVYSDSDISKEEGGRYSTLNRDFTTKSSSSFASTCSFEFIRKSRPVVTCSPEPILPPVPRSELDSDDSTDSLIAEAQEFLSVAERKLVLSTDWDDIMQRKESRIKSKRKSPRKHRELPFVPQKITDLHNGMTIKILTNDRGLVLATVRAINTKEDRLDVAETSNTERVSLPFTKVALVMTA